MLLTFYKSNEFSTLIQCHHMYLFFVEMMWKQRWFNQFLCSGMCVCVCVCVCVWVSSPVQVTRGTSRPCWERWPALSPLAPAAGASSAAPVPLAHSLSSPTPVAEPHFQTRENRREAFNIQMIHPSHHIQNTYIRRCLDRLLHFSEPYTVYKG
jgi:hypothetical protein